MNTGSLSTLLETLMTRLGESFPHIIGAVAILLVGWIVALVVRFGVQRGLSRLRLNERVKGITESALDLEKGSATAVYYLILVLAVIAFFRYPLRCARWSSTFWSSCPTSSPPRSWRSSPG